MKFILALFGVAHGYIGQLKHNVGKDFRKCWPNLKANFVDHLTSQGHQVQIYFSTYPILDKEVETEFFNTIQPTRCEYNEFSNSRQFTTKLKLVDMIAEVPSSEADVIIFCRNDMIFKVPIMEEPTIDFSKFNFLFREKDHWSNLQLTTDNFYIWPHEMSPIVCKVFHETVQQSGRYDMHDVYNFLTKYTNNISMISDLHEFSHLNHFYLTYEQLL